MNGMIIVTMETKWIHHIIKQRCTFNSNDKLNFDLDTF